LDALYSFFSLIALAKTSSTALNGGVLFQILEEKLSTFPHLASTGYGIVIYSL
jgi:hypothetical protein